MSPKTPPMEVIEAIDEWQGLAINAEYHRWRHDVHPPQLLDRPWPLPPNEFTSLAENLICWCDSGGCSVDPTPIDRFCRMIRHIYGQRSCEIVDVLGGEGVTHKALMRAMEDAFQACWRMRIVATSRLGATGLLVRKSELRESLGMGGTKFREFLDSATADGRIVEESRTARYIEIRDDELAARHIEFKDQKQLDARRQSPA